MGVEEGRRGWSWHGREKRIGLGSLCWPVKRENTVPSISLTTWPQETSRNLTLNRSHLKTTQTASIPSVPLEEATDRLLTNGYGPIPKHKCFPVNYVLTTRQQEIAFEELQSFLNNLKKISPLNLQRQINISKSTHWPKQNKNRSQKQ